MSDRIVNRRIRRNDPGRETGITRRGFLAAGGAAALSFFLPCLGSVGEGYAYAVETGSVGANGQPDFTIYVITREEVGLSVVDITNNAKTPIAGASVTLTSSATNVSVTATTDENGLAVFNLKTSNLGTPMQLEGVGDGYRFEGSIKTTVPGQDGTWMDFETGRLRADGGRAIQTPLRQKAGVTDPYFTMLSFDGWDILYTDNDAVETPANTDDHTFAGKLYVPTADSVKIELLAKKTGEKDIVVFSKTAAPQSNFVEFSQTARYLFIYSGNKDLLADGRDYVYRVTVGTVPYAVTTKFTVRQAPVDEPVYLSSSIAPSEQSLGSFSLPSDIPFPLGGSSLSVWVPSFPFMGWISPFGYAFLAATLSTTFKNSAPCTDSTAWRQETCGSAADQFEYLTDTWSNSLNKLMDTPNMLNPSASVKDKFSMGESLSLDLTMQIYLLGEWDLAKKLWRLTNNAIVVANLAFSFTARTTIGPVPLFLTFKLGLSGKISASFGVETIDFKTIDIPKSAGIAFTTTVSVALTLGVGVPGVASAGLRGSGFITTYVSFLDTSGAVPHVIVGYGLAADVVIQMLLFTWTGKLWSYKDASLYDNASYGLLQDVRPDLTLNPTDFALGSDAAGAPVYSHDAPFDPMKGLDLAEFIKQCSIVTENDLSKTREVRGARIANAALLSAAAAPQITKLENGTAVVDLSGTGAAADGAEGAVGVTAPSEFSYEYVGENLDEICEAVGGVAGLAASGGVVPSVDKKIVTRTFSHPNCKVVVFFDTPYLFRLISVEYDDGGEKKTRTRLAVQKMNASGKWTTPAVLEFPRFASLTGIGRIDTFDYEFDVFANSAASAGNVDSGLCVTLLSGTRPQGDATSFFSASNSTVMTIATFDGDLRCMTNFTWKDVPGSDSVPYQSLLLPRIAPVRSGGEDSALTGLALLYLRRTASSPEAVLGDGATVTVECAYMTALQLFMGEREPVDPGTYELTVLDSSGAAANQASFSFAAHSSAGTSITTIFPSHGSGGMSFSVKHNVANATGLENGKPWPGRPAILVPEDGVLTALSFDPSVEGGALTKTKIGPEDAKITTFALSPSGNALFYLVNQEGDAGQGYDDDGNPTSTEKIASYSIYACVCVDDLFTRPFPLATVNHAIDALENAYVGSTYSFIATCITSMANKSADIYYINVPVVATAAPLGFVAENSFVCAGASGEPFLMEIRNDGNVILKGCTVELRDADLPEPNNVVSTCAGLQFSGALTGSIWNPELLAPASDDDVALQAEEAEPTYAPETLAALGIGEDHVLVNPAASGSLLPGASGQYRVRFDIPASWTSGYKNVYITLKDFMYDMVAYAPGAEIAHHPTSLGADNAHTVTISAVEPENGGALGDALLAPEGSTPGGQTPDGQTPNGQSSGGSSVFNDRPTIGGQAGTGDGGVKGSKMAQTGDGAPATVAGLVLAAAAAGAVAYSARRRVVERERHEANEAEHDE